VSRAGATVQPLERAQVVWRRAVRLSSASAAATATLGPGTHGEVDGETFGLVLDLLRIGHHGPSTMLHALALGREQQRVAPGDARIRDAVRLLARTTEWLGSRTEDGEVGTAAAASRERRAGRRQATAPTRSADHKRQ
jgi:hypothetical protein